MEMYKKNMHNIHTQKFKFLTVNVNVLNNNNKRIKIFNSLKTKKNDIILLQETHSTKTTETKWQQEWIYLFIYILFTVDSIQKLTT